jgi:Mn-dependent DtxR family transcriptional regulator
LSCWFYYRKENLFVMSETVQTLCVCQQTNDRWSADRQFLAELLGVRRSTVSEVLEPFQAQGLIRYSRGKCTVLDREGLMAGSCECYRVIAKEFERLFS